MHAAITGAAGFIGSHVSERLIADGWEVVGIDNFDDFYPIAVKRANVERALESPRFTLAQVDIRDALALRRAIEGVDVVVHLAARAGVRPSFAEPASYADVNVTGTANLLGTVADLQIPRFVFGSSSSVYGEGTPTPFSEEVPLGIPASPYAVTKVAGEMMARLWSQHIPHVTLLRFFTVYGPRQRPDLAIHKFANLIDSSDEIPVYGDAHETYRDYTYIQDVVDGVIASLSLETALDVINLGSGRPVTLEATITSLEEALGKKARRKALPAQPGDLPYTWANIDRAREQLAYKPEWEFKDGIAAFVEWIRGKG